MRAWCGEARIGRASAMGMLAQALDHVWYGSKKVICPLESELQSIHGTFVPGAGLLYHSTYLCPFLLSRTPTLIRLADFSRRNVRRNPVVLSTVSASCVHVSRLSGLLVPDVEKQKRVFFSPEWGCEKKFSIRILYIEISTRSSNFKLKPRLSAATTTATTFATVLVVVVDSSMFLLFLLLISLSRLYHPE
ncbi:hypothetical protein M0802_004622 [Mischocyttarus mexicanus]|nr:hypothetical protein M0802_004622 [Mischocyttarus mexicanus]